jgi:hypothetical protein
VQRTEDIADEPRFAMLETVREFALELLESNGEADALRARHADYYVRVRRRGRADCAAAREPCAARQADYNNLRRAVLESSSNDPCRGALRLTGALPGTGISPRSSAKAAGGSKLALALSGADAPTSARAKVLWGAASRSIRARPTMRSRTRRRASHCFARPGIVPAAFALFHLGLGALSSSIGRRYRRASAGEQLFRDVGDQWGGACAGLPGIALAVQPDCEDERASC